MPIVIIMANNSRAIETSPSGRYVRYGEVIGRGSYKTVFRGFDRERGTEVAWSKISLSNLEVDAALHTQIQKEVDLLKDIDCPNIIRLFASWFSSRNNEFHIVTEIFLSGSLKEYLKRHGHVSMGVVKQWTREVLDGLIYLHGRKPPVVHRDVKCDNILIRGDDGKIKLGDLGLSTLKVRSALNSVVGTPEFMPEEMFNSDYDERVDVYSMGMCMLEMITLEYPYAECANIAQVYRKKMAKEPPECIESLKDSEVKRFIKLCVSDKKDRPSALQLSEHPALAMPVRASQSESTAYEKSRESSESRENADANESRARSTYPRKERRSPRGCCFRS